MDELVRWLGEQLAEDERIARAAATLQADPENGWGISERAITPHIGVVHEDEARAHITEWDPARVLREIESKRRMIGRISNHATIMGRDEVHGDLLRSLAEPYSDRPGYAEAIASLK
jgi:hypothetical protein